MGFSAVHVASTRTLVATVTRSNPAPSSDDLLPASCAFQPPQNDPCRAWFDAVDVDRSGIVNRSRTIAIATACALPTTGLMFFTTIEVPLDDPIAERRAGRRRLNSSALSANGSSAHGSCAQGCTTAVCVERLGGAVRGAHPAERVESAEAGIHGASLSIRSRSRCAWLRTAADRRGG